MDAERAKLRFSTTQPNNDKWWKRCLCVTACVAVQMCVCVCLMCSFSAIFRWLAACYLFDLFSVILANSLLFVSFDLLAFCSVFSTPGTSFLRRETLFKCEPNSERTQQTCCCWRWNEISSKFSKAKHLFVTKSLFKSNFFMLIGKRCARSHSKEYILVCTQNRYSEIKIHFWQFLKRKIDILSGGWLLFSLADNYILLHESERHLTTLESQRCTLLNFRCKLCVCLVFT